MARDHQREIERFTRQAEQAVKNDGPAAGPEGRVLTQRHVLALTKFIADVREKRPTRKTRAQKSLSPEVWDLVAGVPDQEIAVAALTGVLNATATPRREADLEEFIDGEEEESIWDTGTARAAKELIGLEIERQVEGCWLQVGEPEMAARIERATAGSRKERRATQNRILREEGVERVRWKRLWRIQVGNWAFDCCLKALPGVIVEDEFRAPMISQEAWEDAANAATLKMLDHPIWTPDFEPSALWTSFHNEDGQPFLRHCRDKDAAKSAFGGNGRMRSHVDAVNYLKSIAYRINEPVADFVQRLGARRVFLDIKGRWDRGPWRVFDYDMAQAARLRGHAFWTDQSCDFRGRVNPLPHFHFGRGDHIRALFKFARGEPITDRGIFWLKVATANCFNEGKAIASKSFEERAAWTEQNLDRIRALACDPHSGLQWVLPWLSRASDPFQFLAHAIELDNALRAGPGFVTTLPIAFDASNSGAQHYSLLVRDPDGAQETNLLGGINDLYDAIQRRAIVDLDEALKVPGKARHAQAWLSREEIISRKLFKRLVMTFLYGQKKGGHKKALVAALADRNYEFVVDEIEDEGKPTPIYRVERHRLKAIDLPEGQLDYFVDLVRAAIERQLPGAVDVMNFVRTIAKALAEAGKALKWVSLSGVPVCNLEHKPDVHSVKLWLDDRPAYHEVSTEWLPEIDVAACVRSSAPNLVHSCDAAHLALVALACECEHIPLACVHDSFATLPCHADKMREILLRELRDMYRDRNLLQEIHDYASHELPAATLPPVPAPRGLDLDQVTGPYAFA
jgi:DNA-dependent RNA polymerase